MESYDKGHLIHSYGVNVIHYCKNITGKNNVNSYSLLLLTLESKIMPSIIAIFSVIYGIFDVFQVTLTVTSQHIPFFTAFGLIREAGYSHHTMTLLL